MKDEIKEILEALKHYDFSLDVPEKVEIMINKILDYITNLQEENKILKENSEHNDKVVDKARWNEMIYKSRNKKAIEYIEKYKFDYEIKEKDLYIIQSVVPEFRLLEILKGQMTEKQLERLLQGEDKE